MSKKWREVSKWTFGDLTSDQELFEAARYNDFDRVKELIGIGANVNLINPIHNAPPLIAAVARGHIEAVQLLIANGADVNITVDDGWSPLMIATNTTPDKNQIMIAKLLLDAGADINHKNKFNDTAEAYISSFISSPNKEIENNYKEMANLLKEARKKLEII